MVRMRMPLAIVGMLSLMLSMTGLPDNQASAADSDLAIGIMLLSNTTNYAEARTRLVQAAARGEMAAYYPLANMYRYGIGGPADLPRAVLLYEKSIAGGSGEAADTLGRMYLYGDGVARDMPRGIGLLETSPNASRHAFLLARLYHTGPADIRNDAKALYWYEAANFVGSGELLFDLSRELRDGKIDHPNRQVELTAFTMVAAALDHEAAKLATRQLKLTLSRTIALRAIDRAEGIAIKADYPKQVRKYLADLFGYFEQQPR